jgi:hypothetical protein
MPNDATEFSALLERYRSLGAADRRAVRRKLSGGECETLEIAAAQIVQEQRSEQAPENQFRGYSPWLAALIKRSLDVDGRQPDVTPACRAAIASAHLSMLDDLGEESIVARLARLLGVAGPRDRTPGSPPC